MLSRAQVDSVQSAPQLLWGLGSGLMSSLLRGQAASCLPAIEGWAEECSNAAAGSTVPEEGAMSAPHSKVSFFDSH